MSASSPPPLALLQLVLLDPALGELLPAPEEHQPPMDLRVLTMCVARVQDAEGRSSHAAADALARQRLQQPGQRGTPPQQLIHLLPPTTPPCVAPLPAPPLPHAYAHA